MRLGEIIYNHVCIALGFCFFFHSSSATEYKLEYCLKKNLSNHVGACQEYKPIHKSLYCIMNHFLCCRKDLLQISFRFNIINESHEDTGLRGQEREIFLYTNFPSMCNTESDISCYLSHLTGWFTDFRFSL